MRKRVTTLFIVLCTFFMVTVAQEEIKVEVSGSPVLGVSPNGKYIVGGGADGKGGFLYDTENAEFINFDAGDLTGNTFQGASNDGWIVGRTGGDSDYQAAIFKDGEWIILPHMENGTGNSYVISEDNKVIAGYMSAKGQSLYEGCVWEEIDGEYKLTILPMPEKDIFGGSPQGARVHSMSQNGELIIGRYTGASGDASGMGNYVLPIVWTKIDGIYEYKILGEDIHYNLDEEAPVYKDKGMTQEEWDLFDELMEKFKIKGVKIFPYFMEVSGNGRYLATSIITSDPPLYANSTHSILLFDLESDTHVILSDPISNSVYGTAVMNDGTVLGASPYASHYMRNGYVFTPEEEGYSEMTPIENWLKEKFEVEFPSIDEVVYTGTPFVSANDSLIGAYFQNSSSDAVMFHYFKIEKEEEPGGPGPGPEPTNITNNSTEVFNYWSEDSNLYIVVETSQKLPLYSIDGCLINNLTLKSGENVVSNLPKGIYLLNNKKIVIQ